MHQYHIVNVNVLHIFMALSNLSNFQHLFIRNHFQIQFIVDTNTFMAGNSVAEVDINII